MPNLGGDYVIDAQGASCRANTVLSTWQGNWFATLPNRFGIWQSGYRGPSLFEYGLCVNLFLRVCQTAKLPRGSPFHFWAIIFSKKGSKRVQ